MKQFLMLFVLAFLVSGIFAQWSSDSSNPSLIAGGAGEQALPKVALGLDGESYISYFDNSSGGYKVRLKLLDGDGNMLFTNPNGVEMTGSINDTWLTDYDLTTDINGNALVCFQDIRTGTNSIFVYKVSRTGQQLWGENGLSLSVNATTDTPDYTPVIITTTDNNTYVAWQHQSSPSQVMVQKINSLGLPAWTNPVVISETAASCNWPQLLETDGNAILMKYYVDSGPFWAPNRHIKVARINPEGNIAWNQTISNAGGIAAWTQVIGFTSDGAGGAALSWHDDRDANNLNQGFFAHITSSGEISTPANGAYVSSDTFYNHFYPLVVCDPVALEARVAMRVTDANQNQSGLIFQVFDFAGNRQLGDSGNMLENLSSFDHNPHYVWNFGGRFYYFYALTEFSNPNAQILRCAQNRDLGFYNTWYDTPLASTQTPKFHYDFSDHPGGWVIATWEDGTSENDIYAMKYYYNGNVGAFNGAPENVTAEFIPPNSIQVAWDTPQYSTPLSYILQINTDIIELPANINEYTVTDMQPDTYTISMRAVYPGQELSESSNIVTITVVSNDDLIQAISDLSISPNPFRNETNISWTAKAAGKTEITLYNLKGQKIQSALIETASGSQNYSLHGNSLPAGVYLLRMKVNGQSHSKRMILLP